MEENKEEEGVVPELIQKAAKIRKESPYELDDLNLVRFQALDDCIVGLVEGLGRPSVIIYDREKIFKSLMEQLDCSYGDAVEYYTYNLLGSWVGESTPLFLYQDLELEGYVEREQEVDKLFRGE